MKNEDIVVRMLEDLANSENVVENYSDWIGNIKDGRQVYESGLFAGIANARIELARAILDLINDK